jgi:uncharacterized protein (DUF924 family)
MLYLAHIMQAEYLAGLTANVADETRRGVADSREAVRHDRRPQVPHGGAADMVRFWREAGPQLWFAKDAAFDRHFRSRFLALHESAASGALASWRSSAEGALALVLLLDQFPRNAFRGTPRMYATDESARAEANAALAAGHDAVIEPDLRLFFCLPFAHSEDIAHQERSVLLCRALGADKLAHAEHHRDIVRRFGRFPHRNAILGRRTTPAEQRFLDDGGFAG